VLRAARELSVNYNANQLSNQQDPTSKSNQNKVSMSTALDKYCALKVLDVEDQQFCYNIDTMRGDINRLLDMGADETRVCKKVRSINPDFCSNEKKDRKKKTAVHINQSQRRGIIFD
jgi:hypothetical protein